MPPSHEEPSSTQNHQTRLMKLHAINTTMNGGHDSTAASTADITNVNTSLPSAASTFRRRPRVITSERGTPPIAGSASDYSPKSTSSTISTISTSSSAPPLHHHSSHHHPKLNQLLVIGGTPRRRIDGGVSSASPYSQSPYSSAATSGSPQGGRKLISFSSINVPGTPPIPNARSSPQQTKKPSVVVLHALNATSNPTAASGVTNKPQFDRASTTTSAGTSRVRFPPTLTSSSPSSNSSFTSPTTVPRKSFIRARTKPAVHDTAAATSMNGVLSSSRLTRLSVGKPGMQRKNSGVGQAYQNNANANGSAAARATQLGLRASNHHPPQHRFDPLADDEEEDSSSASLSMTLSPNSAQRALAVLLPEATRERAGNRLVSSAVAAQKAGQKWRVDGSSGAETPDGLHIAAGVVLPPLTAASLASGALLSSSSSSVGGSDKTKKERRHHHKPTNSSQTKTLATVASMLPRPHSAVNDSSEPPQTISSNNDDDTVISPGSHLLAMTNSAVMSMISASDLSLSEKRRSSWQREKSLDSTNAHGTAVNQEQVVIVRATSIERTNGEEEDVHVEEDLLMMNLTNKKDMTLSVSSEEAKQQSPAASPSPKPGASSHPTVTIDRRNTPPLTTSTAPSSSSTLTINTSRSPAHGQSPSPRGQHHLPVLTQVDSPVNVGLNARRRRSLEIEDAQQANAVITAGLSASLKSPPPTSTSASAAAARVRHQHHLSMTLPSSNYGNNSTLSVSSSPQHQQLLSSSLTNTPRQSGSVTDHSQISRGRIERKPSSFSGAGMNLSAGLPLSSSADSFQQSSTGGGTISSDAVQDRWRRNLIKRMSLNISFSPSPFSGLLCNGAGGGGLERSPTATQLSKTGSFEAPSNAAGHSPQHSLGSRSNSNSGNTNPNGLQVNNGGGSGNGGDNSHRASSKRQSFNRLFMSDRSERASMERGDVLGVGNNNTTTVPGASKRASMRDGFMLLNNIGSLNTSSSDSASHNNNNNNDSTPIPPLSNSHRRNGHSRQSSLTKSPHNPSRASLTLPPSSRSPAGSSMSNGGNSNNNHGYHTVTAPSLATQQLNSHDTTTHSQPYPHNPSFSFHLFPHQELLSSQREYYDQCESKMAEYLAWNEDQDMDPVCVPETLHPQWKEIQQKKMAYASLTNGHPSSPPHSASQQQLLLPYSHPVPPTLPSSFDTNFWNCYTTIQNWDTFDIFNFSEYTSGWPLSFMFVIILKKHDMFTKLKLNEKVTFRFIQEVESHYLPNPYHSCYHAADVLHAVYHFLNDSILRDQISDWDKFLLYLSCAIHDFAHPGVTNGFLTASRAPLAIRYNDKSILENFHVSSAFRMMQITPGCNVLESCVKQNDPKVYQRSRKMLIDLVLATDLAVHFDLMRTMKTRFDAILANATGNTQVAQTPITGTGSSAQSGTATPTAKHSKQLSNVTLHTIPSSTEGSVATSTATPDHHANSNSDTFVVSTTANTTASTATATPTTTSTTTPSHGHVSSISRERTNVTTPLAGSHPVPNVPFLNLTSDADITLVLQLLLKLGDLSHPARPKLLHLRWAELVTEEFFMQGDRERSLSLPPSMFMSRYETNVATSQLGFLTFLVLPLFQLSAKLQQNTFWVKKVEKNLELWGELEKIEKREQAQKEAEEKAAAAGIIIEGVNGSEGMSAGVSITPKSAALSTGGSDISDADSTPQGDQIPKSPGSANSSIASTTTPTAGADGVISPVAIIPPRRFASICKDRTVLGMFQRVRAIGSLDDNTPSIQRANESDSDLDQPSSPTSVTSPPPNQQSPPPPATNSAAIANGIAEEPGSPRYYNDGSMPTTPKIDQLAKRLSEITVLDRELSSLVIPGH